jgi:arylamine N-acetyltransferase
VSSPTSRYLKLLGVEAASPGSSFLEALVRAQLYRVPFENVSKLYHARVEGRRFMPDLETHLDGIESGNFGGTCYPNNSHFCELLQHLGFEARRCGADMSNPDAHLVSMVALEGREYLVDVGYAAPFDRPLPLDLEHEIEMSIGRQRYLLHPRDRHGRSRMDLICEGKLIHGYLAKPEPRKLSEFHDMIADSYRPQATFMNTVVAERFFPGRSLRIHGLKLTESTGDRVTATRLADRDELVDALVTHFQMPADTVREAITGVNLGGEMYT